MAKASWLNVNPTSGSGNGRVGVKTASEYSGRNARQTIVVWKAANVADKQRTVNQAGKPEYVDIADSASSEKAGKVVTITGISNSSLLTFSLGIGDLDISLPSHYIANSVSTENGVAIAGDPGANAAFNFSISITVPANETISEQTRQIIVTDNAGNTDVCLLTLAAGDPYVNIAEGIIELTYQGTEVIVAVESNTNWTVE